MIALAVVTKADRDAAASFSADAARCGMADPHIVSCLEGRSDGTKIVQAFAHHRIAAEAASASLIKSQASRIEELEGAMREIADTPNNGWMIARAILSKIGEQK